MNKTTSTARIYFTQNRRSFSVPFKKGQTVLDTALTQGHQLDFKCKKGTCGKCQIQVLKDEVGLTPANEAEQKRLSSKVHSGYRLSCQARMV
ncbi:2Fe-2S iron-sulfur cluster-binding protein [Pseudalkalibacillus decolorationis]|uniref:2Fe-2S iron-sulfur cluster-binding protein n=1 Tax=Pseudalkalibacillus decolorationis TaxID=163879 RepID=UPI0035566BDA